MKLVADLHNHSCLSPCGDLYMSPSVLAHTAKERGVSVLALTDHNSARNAPAFAQACKQAEIFPVFGTETTSQEEVHVLSLFPTVDDALSWGAWVYERLPDFRHDPERFGDQVVVDVDENIVDVEERYLITGIDASIDDIVQETLARGGLVIPAHIDRTAHSLLSQLGFVPDAPFSALEVTKWPPKGADENDFAFISSSDAHFVDDIARRTTSFEAEISVYTEEGAIFHALADAIGDRRTRPSIAR